jgi:hypothetical protein
MSRRWVPYRKAALVAAVDSGQLSIEDALHDNEISLEEFEGWRRDLERHGVWGLRTTRLQIYNQDRLSERARKRGYGTVFTITQEPA